MLRHGPFKRRLSWHYCQTRSLTNAIERVKPDVVHSIEFQHSSYLTLDAMRGLKGSRPPWIVTNYGNDIYLFGQMEEHASRIRDVLNECDFYHCETDRDVRLAREFGYAGEVFEPILANTGGYPLNVIQELKKVPTSKRRLIAVKGYQHLRGRSFVALRGVERCADVLAGYGVVVYAANNDDVRQLGNLISRRSGVRISVMPYTNNQLKILRLHANARMSIGCCIADGASISFLEALMMGSYPIQSCTAAADEWIEHGKTGAIVHPDDPETVEAAIRQAVADDDLVDRAAEKNWETALARLDYDMIRQHAIQWYESAAINDGQANNLYIHKTENEIPPTVGELRVKTA